MQQTNFAELHRWMPSTSLLSVSLCFPSLTQGSLSVGVGMFITTYVYMFTWVYTGEVNAKRVREHYLRAILRQDIAFFDSTGAGEVATRIQTDTRMLFLPATPVSVNLHSCRFGAARNI